MRHDARPIAHIPNSGEMFASTLTLPRTERSSTPSGSDKVSVSNYYWTSIYRTEINIGAYNWTALRTAARPKVILLHFDVVAVKLFIVFYYFNTGLLARWQNLKEYR